MAQVYKLAGIEAAKIAGRSPEMDAAAQHVLARVKVVAAQHRRTGRYIAALEVKNVRGKHGVRDRLVSATDPASLSIEYGHYATKVTKSSTSRRASSGALTWVPGQFIMTKARGSL